MSSELESRYAELRRLLDYVSETRALEALRQIAQQAKKEGGHLEAVPVDVLTIIVSVVKATEIPSDFDWGGFLKPAILRAMRHLVLRSADGTKS